MPHIKPTEYTPFKLREWSPTRRREHSPIKTREFSPIRRRKFSPAKHEDVEFGDEARPKRPARAPKDVDEEPMKTEKKPAAEKAAPVKGTKPNFVQVPPAEISVHEGEPLTLRCVVDGEPKPVGECVRENSLIPYSEMCSLSQLVSVWGRIHKLLTLRCVLDEETKLVSEDHMLCIPYQIQGNLVFLAGILHW